MACTETHDGRAIPPGIILEDYTDDEEIGLLKSGKEADVYLVERHGSARSCLLAEKRYRPAEHRAFRNDLSYRAHRRLDGLRRDGDRWRKPELGRTVQKAMDQKTGFGRRVLFAQWMDAEWSILRAVWDAGARVPYPVARLGEGILMEYVGDREQAAPQLVHSRLGRSELEPVFEQVRQNMCRFIDAGYVHADLSAYNILLWDGEAWVIDLPQAVPLLGNENALDFLHRDCLNVCTWFARKGLDVDGEDLFVALLDDVFRYRMEDLYLAKG